MEKTLLLINKETEGVTNIIRDLRLALLKFENDNMVSARQTIASKVQAKIQDGDMILTYGL